MKKLLLLAAGAMLVSSAAKAEESTVSPAVYPGYMLTALSANGEWTVSVDPYTYTLTIINLKTGETYQFGDGSGMEVYDGGMTRFVSNNGVVVGVANESTGVYWENGQMNALPSKDGDFAMYPNTITPDGNVIGGSVSRMALTLEEVDDVMTVPVVWYRNAAGGYDNYVELPYPKTDWTGRVPQYVQIDDISADGKVCAGCLTDYAGMAQMPIVFTQKDNGEWEYTLVHPELLNPEGVEFPKYPGEAPEMVNPTDWMSAENIDKYNQALADYANRPYPQMTDYMSAEELAAYQEAMDIYNSDPWSNPYPFMSDFMTEEETAAYNNAVTEYYSAPQPNPTDFMSENQVIMYNMAIERYNVAMEKWSEEYAAFDEALQEVFGNPDIPSFMMNSAIISPNGKYLGYTANKYVEDPNSWFGYSTVAVPYVFDLETGEYVVMEKGQNNVLAIQLSDEGWMLGAAPAGSTTRQAYIAKGLDASFVQLIDVVKESDIDVYNWMKDNMTHYVEDVDYVYDETTGDYEPVVNVREEVAEGTTYASTDFKVFAGWALNNWDMMDENYVYSYVYGVNHIFDGVKTVAAKNLDFGVNAQIGGTLNVIGDVTNVTVYDVTGRKVFSADAPAGQIATGLTNGTYVVTAKAADGHMITKKVAF